MDGEIWDMDGIMDHGCFGYDRSTPVSLDERNEIIKSLSESRDWSTGTHRPTHPPL
jgi:hypothetical protein